LRRAYKRRLLSSEEIDELRLLLAELIPKHNAYIRAVGKPKRLTATNNKVQSPKA
jgi:hypothetical protein